MATQTSLVAQQVRIRQWAEQIRNCQNRPKGMDVETWCTQNNLTKANYYYRLRRVRQICLDQMQDTETTAFVELPAPAPDPKKTDTSKESGTCISAGTLPMIRIKNTRGLSAEIFSGTSPEMLCHLIKTFSVSLILTTKIHCFFSVEEDVTGSKHCSGKAMVFSLCTRDSIMVHSGGPVRQMRQWRSQTTSTVC